MNEKETQKTIAAALSRTGPLTVTECTQLNLQVHNALVAIGDRLSRTAPATNRTSAGVEYLRVLKTGTQEEVTRMEEEHECLRVLADQLKAQRDELGQRRMDARFQEARIGLPALQALLWSAWTVSRRRKLILIAPSPC